MLHARFADRSRSQSTGRAPRRQAHPNFASPDHVNDPGFDRQLQTVAENATLALFIMDEQQQCTYMNPAAERLTGFTLAELQGKPLHDYIHHTHPDGRPYPLAECPIDQAFPQNMREQGEEVFVHKQGHFYPVAFTASPIREGDRTVGTIIEVRDITEEKRAEAERRHLLESLELERARLADVFRRAPAFLAVLRGPEHRFELVNDAYYQLIGHREIIGKPVLEALPEIAGQGFAELLDSVYATGERYVGHEAAVLLARKPGVAPEQRFVDLVYLPALEADGSRSGVIAHGSDVTEQVLARREVEALAAQLQDNAVELEQQVEQAQAITVELEERQNELVTANAALATSEERFRLMFQRHPLPMWVFDLQTLAFLDVNDAAVRRYGYTRDEFLGMTLREIRPAEDLPRLEQTLAERGSGVMVLRGGHRHCWKDGTTRDVEITTSETEYDGRPARLALVQDVTERVRAEAERERLLRDSEAAQAEAERANQAKSQFLATMSHEIRTPINAITGYTQLLEIGIAGPLTPRQQEYVERVQGSSEHLLGLVNDILDLSKIEAGEMRVRRDRRPVRRVASAALELVIPQARAKNIELSDLSEACSDAVAFLGDEDRVRQILVNLLGNAVKFTEPGGRVTLRCHAGARPAPGSPMPESQTWLALEVEDTGIGIAPADAEGVFDPFVQVDGGSTRKQGGTGLGLTISRKLARLMGGDLAVRSLPGEGSCFTLWLPAAADEPGDQSDGGDWTRTWSTRVHEVPGLSEIGHLLARDADPLVQALGAQLRADPAIPGADRLDRAQLEDHIPTLVLEIGKALITLETGGNEPRLLHDGDVIQRTIAQLHGEQRRRLGWTADQLRREYELQKQLVDQLIVRNAHPSNGDTTTARGIVRRLFERAEVVSLAAFGAETSDPAPRS